MRQFSLEVGLVVRRGRQQLEFISLLQDNKIQFQDQKTKLFSVMKLSVFYKEVMAKKIQPIIGEERTTEMKDDLSSSPSFVFDWSSIDESNRKKLVHRLQWVQALRKRAISRGQTHRIRMAIVDIAEKLKDNNPPAQSTLSRWMRKFELSQGNPVSLILGNLNRKRRRQINSLVEAEITKKIRNIYLKPARHTLRHTHEQILLALKKMADQKQIGRDEAQVSLATVSRRLSEFDSYESDKARYGPGYARAKYRTTVEGSLATRVMQRLQCDHTLLNWVVVCDRTGLPLGRPTLTIIIDTLSGYVVGIYVSFYGPGVTSVLNVLKNAIRPKDEFAQAASATNPWLAYGIGECLVLDNGMEFHSKIFQSVAWELGIDLEYCRVRSPWLKPHVERFFANLDYFSLTKGRVRKPMANVINIDPVQDAAILFGDFLRGLIKFVVDVYPFELNSRKLVTPFEAFQEGFNALRPPTFQWSLDQLNLIAAMHKTVKVSQTGVELGGIPYSSPQLRDIRKKAGANFMTNMKWDPDDISFVYVQHPREKTWLPTPSIWTEYTTGFGWNQHQLVNKFKRENYVKKGGLEALLLARQAVHEIWMNGIVKKNRSSNMRLAAKYTGLSSNQILASDLPRLEALSANSLLLPDEISQPIGADVPDFGSFVMGAKR